ncbi:hypothetical protein B5F40_01205 [Gordonibacter sp. An230]|nr:hypothetical protein B5F40_01205 [Gordonibacter sp. An230]
MASARGASGEGKAESAQGARGKAAAGTPGRIGSESHGNAKPGKSDAEPSGTETKADTETQSGRSVSAEAKRAVTSAMENHGHAVLYGTIGFVAAALILIVGFWPTVLLALFAAVGVAIGMYRDGDRAARERVSSVLKRLT